MSEVIEVPDTFEAYSKSLADVEFETLLARVSELHHQMWAIDMPEENFSREELLQAGWHLELSRREIEASEVKWSPLCTQEDGVSGGSSIFIKVKRLDDELTEDFVRRWVWAKHPPRYQQGRYFFQHLGVYLGSGNEAICELQYVQDN